MFNIYNPETNLKEESFKSEASECLVAFNEQLDKMKNSAKDQTLTLIDNLQTYSKNLQSFLAIKNPSLKEIAELGKQTDLLSKQIENCKQGVKQLAGIDVILKAVKLISSAAVNHPSKVQRLCKATEGVALMTAGTAIAAGGTFLALATTAPTFFMSWCAIPISLQAGAVVVGMGVEMISVAAKDNQIQTGLNAMMQGLKTLHQSAEKIQQPNTKNSFRS